MALSGGVQDNGHVQNIGWMGWGAPGALVGTTGRSLRLESVHVRLTGELAKHYSVRYSAHVQDIGWQPWVFDGATAGTLGQAKRVEAVKIQLVPKTF